MEVEACRGILLNQYDLKLCPDGISMMYKCNHILSLCAKRVTIKFVAPINPIHVRPSSGDCIIYYLNYVTIVDYDVRVFYMYSSWYSFLFQVSFR
jgi:hypothetical protein